MGIIFFLCRKYDDSKAYVQFFPSWHEKLVSGVCGNSSSLGRTLGAQLVLVLVTNHYLAVLFVLPTL